MGTTIRTLVAASWIASTPVANVHPAWAADAEDLAKQGLALRREGKDQEALPLFQEAARRDATPRALAQLGLCEQALGLWLAAETHIMTALENDQDPWIRKHEPALRESLVVVKEKLGAIEVWGTPAGARVSLDGQRVGNLPISQAIRVAEGRHVLMVEALGFLSDSRILNVRPGALTREHFGLASADVAGASPALSPLPLPSPSAPTASGPVPAHPERPGPLPTGPVYGQGQADAPPPPGAASELPTWRRVLPWSLLAGAVVMGAVGLWQNTVWYRGVDKFDAVPGQACGESAPMKGSDPTCQGLYDDFSAARLRTFVFYGAAGALGIGAVVSFLVTTTNTDDAGRAAVGLDLRPGNTSLSYVMTF
jgi:hypothetical protein